MILISASDGQRRKALPGQPPGSRGDSLPVFSRDGSPLAFAGPPPLSRVEDTSRSPQFRRS